MLSYSHRAEKIKQGDIVMSTYTTAHKVTHLPPELAFEAAIRSGNLSDDPDAKNYAGNYMYMGNSGNTFSFKHIDTRKYLKFDI